MHGNEYSTKLGMEAGTLLRNARSLQLADVGEVPPEIAPRDALYWQVVKDVHEYMLEHRTPSASKACRETGWDYEVYRRAKKNPYAQGMLAEAMNGALQISVEYMTQHLLGITTAMVNRAMDESDPQGVRAALLVFQEIKEKVEQMDVEDAHFPQISSAALLNLGGRTSVKMQATRKRSAGGNSVEETVEIVGDAAT
jgi:hypothetical protein